MADFQGPNMSHDWLMEIGSKMVTIMREEKERNEKMTDQVRWVVVYEMKDGTEMRQPLYSDEELKHERATADIEKSSKGTHVQDYRVEYPKPEDQ